MKSIRILALCCLPLGSAFGASGIFGSYINVTATGTNGGVNYWYDAQAPLGARNGDPNDFNGYSFGSFSLTDTFALSGAEVLTYKNGGSNVTGAAVVFSIYPDGSSPSAWTTIPIAWTADATFADAAGTSYSGGGDQKWSSSVGSTNLLTGLTSGNYKMAVYLTASTESDGTQFSNNGGSNYIANFSVIPEPSAALLGALGTLAFFRRRR